MRCALCFRLQPGDLLPGLPETYHPQTDRRAHEENAGESDAIGAKQALFYAAFRAGKSSGKGFIGSVKKFVSLVKNDSFLVRIKI